MNLRVTGSRFFPAAFFYSLVETNDSRISGRYFINAAKAANRHPLLICIAALAA
jgi:hypothetical protein